MFGNWIKTSILMAGIVALFGAMGAAIGGDEHVKLTRLALALARSLSVHVTATAGRAADMVNASTAERHARQDDGDDLIPRLRMVTS